jgi:hypothetical protein
MPKILSKFTVNPVKKNFFKFLKNSLIINILFRDISQRDIIT